MAVGELVREQTGALDLFTHNKDRILNVLSILGFEKSSSELPELERLTAPWVQGDHWNPKNQQTITSDGQTALMNIFRDMGLVEAVMPTCESYDHIVILGGTTRGNVRFTRFIKDLIDEGRLRTDSNEPIDLLAGQRLRERREDSHLTELLEEVEHDAWIARESSKNGQGWQAAFASETELAKLAVSSVFGNLKQEYASLSTGLQPCLPSVPYRAIAWRGYSTAQGQRLRIFNAAAVPRRYGEPRHTTSSSIAEWLKIVKPRQNASILTISSNPHIQRVGLDVGKTLFRLGRDDLSVDAAGVEAVAYAGTEVFLGEVGRMIYNAANQS